MKRLPLTYTPVYKALHWSLALLILGMLCLGLYMSDYAPKSLHSTLIGYHKSIGILILTLVTVRSLYKFFNPQPRSLPAPWYQHAMATAAHLTLYVFMFAMPLSGWLMSSAGGHAVSFFNLFTLPALGPVDPAVSDLAFKVHATIATVFWYVIGLHVAGALYHHFIKKDSTLRRMLP